MFRKVLVPLDGSREAESVLPYVSALAKGLNIPIVVLTVIDADALELGEMPTAETGEETHLDEGGTVLGVETPTVVHGGEERPPHPHEPGGPYPTQFLDAVEERVRRMLRGVVERLAGRGLQVQMEVAFGKPAEQITAYARTLGCDIIAMSTRGLRTLAPGLLGTVTDKVLHSAGVPVLTITPEKARLYHPVRDGGEGREITRIMVPLDGSRTAEEALPYAEYLAERLGMEILLVRAVRRGVLPFSLETLSEEWEQRWRTQAEHYLERVAQALRERGFTVSTRVVVGSPAEAISQLARVVPQDLVALTTHGRTGLGHWLLGSVAEELVRISPDPVLVIPVRREEG